MTDNQNKSGMVIKSLIPGSPAVEAGIKEGDRLIAIDDQPINDAADYLKITQNWSPTRIYSVIRGNQFLSFTLNLKERTGEAPNYEEVIASLESSKEPKIFN